MDGPLLVPLSPCDTTSTSTRRRNITRDDVQSDEAESEKTSINSNVNEIKSSILERREYYF